VTGHRIPELIEQLGATEYATREKAQAELAKLGLDAFEALFEAQHHRDLEIATRARYLIRGMNVRWYQDNDPVEVKRLLKNYGEASAESRRLLIDKLLSMQDPAVLPVVCRLVRYESDLMLSKYAAVGLMEHEPKLTDGERSERAAMLRAATLQGKRAATAWLRNYALTLEDPAKAIPKWKELIAEEIDLRERASDQTSDKICIDLLRYEVGLLKKLGQQEQAGAEIDRVIKLTGKSPLLPQMEELTGWLVAQEAWDKVLAFYGTQQQAFAEHPPLLYRVAQAQRKLKKDDEAAATAKQALGIRPESYEEHLITAIKLKESGLFDWAQQEFELVSKTTTAGSPHDIRARLLLSEMLHDQAKELAAAKTLQVVSDVIEKDNQAAEFAAALRGDIGEIFARMHYFYSLHYAEQKDVKKQTEELDKAIDKSATDADVLIALYRLPNQSPERQKKTKELIDDANKGFREEIQAWRTALERADSEKEQQDFGRMLATSYNQLAWLVGNTTGDYQEALQFSLRSLELRPGEAGHMDTLGRCYYSVGDLTNAVKTQQEACRIDPHSGALKRQLDFFLKEQEKKTTGEKTPQ
jgi:tetratricopeptide (TPR) repeat protein